MAYLVTMETPAALPRDMWERPPTEAQAWGAWGMCDSVGGPGAGVTGTAPQNRSNRWWPSM